MAKSNLNVQLANRNIVLKSETQAQLRAIARAIDEIKNEKLIKELQAGFIVNSEKLVKITVTSAENAESGIEVL